ncbi:hypothetical protein AB0A73_29205 [Glycomyces sp. NPDC047369]|uniref:Uncharacterized protein n=1 Tax=Glycomyces artemisiae TaxID=1076443 RepID=A0A2T0UCR6_9ACTN|nr:hypothetical protein [Glycomyces artemisiae]PRY55709.1 hypothetical protein B0I28_11221 [Glycomyces artemisiae]
MTVDYLSRHLKRDVGVQDLGPSLAEEVEAVRPLAPTTEMFGRLRMRSLWTEAGYKRVGLRGGKHRRRRH